ncbi:helix-turn-helix domain-containing protein [Nocardia sp. NPDC051030]|uniref:TetR/AcrR family transcriptional regulator n=1 Tax=Nocardia sp. NPDC051030 TaxID=3155162 RepID=UPI003424F7E9
MGHREDLLEGAKKCLREKGYARVTARDIVAASHTNLASIGYHFDSKEALLNAALIDALREWGEGVEKTLAGAGRLADAAERYEAVWTDLIRLFATDRELCMANIEVLAQIDHVPSVRESLADALEHGRGGLSQLFGATDQQYDEPTARAVGSFYQALVTGVMVQWMIDPAHAPTGPDMTRALQAIVAGTARA